MPSRPRSWSWSALPAARASEEERGRERLERSLHAQIGRLPERFRAPVVLCYLEGRTCEEATRVLRRPVGTVKSRLATARQRLRHRLERIESASLAGWVGKEHGIGPATVAVST